jgi:hypothetical protein
MYKWLSWLMPLMILTQSALAAEPADELDQALSQAQPEFQRKTTRGLVVDSNSSECTTTVRLDRRKPVRFSWWEDEPQGAGHVLRIDSYLGEALLKFQGQQGQFQMKRALKAAKELRARCE